MKSSKAVKRDVSLFALIAEIKPLMQADPFTKNLSAYPKRHHVDILVDILRKTDWSQSDEQIAYSIIERQTSYRKAIKARREANAEESGVIIDEVKPMSCTPKFNVGDAVFTVTPYGMALGKVKRIHVRIENSAEDGFKSIVFYKVGENDMLQDEHVMSKTEFIERLYKLIDAVKSTPMELEGGETRTFSI